MSEIKVAFSTYAGRIAPVFDTSSELTLVYIEDGKIVRDEVVALTQSTVFELIKMFEESGIRQLVCGGVSRVLQTQLEAAGIKVLPFIAGDISAVKEAWLKDELDKEVYIMPGCCGRRVRGGGFGFGVGRGSAPIAAGRRAGLGRGCGLGFGAGMQAGGVQNAGFGRGVGAGRGLGLGFGRGLGLGFGRGFRAGINTDGQNSGGNQE